VRASRSNAAPDTRGAFGGGDGETPALHHLRRNFAHAALLKFVST